MLETDRLVFLQFQKAASTHIGRMLATAFQATPKSKHARADTQEVADRVVIGSIRNPWAWYVSLWAHGCRNGGALKRRLVTRFAPRYRWNRFTTRPTAIATHAKAVLSEYRKPVGEWRRLYADADDPALFRQWLRMVLDPRRRFDLCEDYAESGVWRFAGFMTHRYLRAFAARSAWNSYCFLDRNSLQRFFRDHNLVTCFIRCENLEQDTLTCMRQAGYEPRLEQMEFMHRSPKTNVSPHRSVVTYYDSETVALVKEKEWLVIDAHGYEFSEQLS